MRLHPLLEQLVDPAIRQLPPRPGQPFELKMELLGRQQALPPMLGIQIGGDQLQRGEVITGDPARRSPHQVHPSGTAAAAPARCLAARYLAAARCPRRGRRRVGRVEDGLERRLGQAAARARARPTESLRAIATASRLDGCRAAARATTRLRSSAGMARVAGPTGNIAGRDLALRRTAQRAPWRARPATPSSSGTRQLVRQPAQRRHEVRREAPPRGRRRPAPARGAHRGIAVNPPATSTPRQNSRPAPERPEAA